MNTQLVDSLAQIIKSLTLDEQQLLSEKLKQKSNWEEEYKKLLEVRKTIFARRRGKPLEIPVDEIIHQMREKQNN